MVHRRKQFKIWFQTGLLIFILSTLKRYTTPYWLYVKLLEFMLMKTIKLQFKIVETAFCPRPFNRQIVNVVSMTVSSESIFFTDAVFLRSFLLQLHRPCVHGPLTIFMYFKIILNVRYKRWENIAHKVRLHPLSRTNLFWCINSVTSSVVNID